MSHDHREPHRHAGHHVHGHAHANARPDRAFAWSIGLNVALVVLQVIYGLIAGSLALIADAGHNLSDVLGLAIAWIAAFAARRIPTVRLTYGFRATSIWAALANAVLIFVACGAIVWEAIERVGAPREVDAFIVIVVAGIGFVVNAASAWLFHGHVHNDLNARGAFLHLMSDAAVSLGVVIAGAAILATGKHWIDPAVSIVVVIIIIVTTWHLFRDALHLMLGGVPAGIDPDVVRGFLAARPGVREPHDLHIWAMSTTEVALTVHLVMPDGHPGDAFLADLAHELEHHFGIHHATIQIERGDGAQHCRLAPEHVV